MCETETETEGEGRLTVSTPGQSVPDLGAGVPATRTTGWGGYLLYSARLTQMPGTHLPPGQALRPAVPRMGSSP